MNSIVAIGESACSAAPATPKRRTLSVRLLWPFLRAAVTSAPTIQLLARHGIGPRRIARPDARVDSGAALGALGAYLSLSGDGSIGARAGASIEPGDLGTVEFAARCCENVREAIACWTRHVRLMHDDAEIRLVEEGGAALCLFRTGGASSDDSIASAFAVAAAATLVRRHARLGGPIREIHLRAAPSRSVRDEMRALATTVRFSMAHDAIVLDRWQLHDVPGDRRRGSLRSGRKVFT